MVRSSPFRRRHRGRVRAMAELVEPLDFALRNTRVLVRRVAVACYRREPIPASYAVLLDDLAECTDAIADELGAGRAATAVRDQLIGARPGHRSQVERSSDLSAEVVLAQVRSLVADLLAVSGHGPARPRPTRSRRCDRAERGSELPHHRVDDRDQVAVGARRRPRAAAGTTPHAGGSPRPGRARRHSRAARRPGPGARGARAGRPASAARWSARRG